MPNLNTTASELEQLFATGWGATTDIAYDNVQYDETLGTSYVELVFVPYTSNNVNLSSQVAGCKRIRHTGVLSITINTPIDGGSGLAYGYADQARGIMENKSPVSNLYTYAADVRRSGAEKDGWYTLIVDIPFSSDEE